MQEFLILYQQMHLNINYNVRILYRTLLHVSAPWCHPHGAIGSLLKLHTVIMFTKLCKKIIIVCNFIKERRVP